MRFHPLTLYQEELDGLIDEVLKVINERVSVVFGTVLRAWDVKRDDMPRSHREVGTVSKVELVIKVRVFISIDLEHVRTALIAGDSLTRAPVLRNHVIEVGRAKRRRELKCGFVVVFKGRYLCVTKINVFRARHEERWFYRDFGFRVIEGLPPVVAFSHDLHH